jgi:hypothetical protein
MLSNVSKSMLKKRVEMISSGGARKHRSLDLTDSKGEDFSH